jgi:hypothetical protein
LPYAVDAEISHVPNVLMFLFVFGRSFSSLLLSLSLSFSRDRLFASRGFQKSVLTIARGRCVPAAFYGYSDLVHVISLSLTLSTPN